MPTASLLRHFALHSPLLKGCRLGSVFGVDNLAGMSCWNEPSELLKHTDLILVAREMQEVRISRDPGALLSALKHFCVEEKVSVSYEGQELFGELGSFQNVGAKGSALLLLLPALQGANEHLSSTKMRESMVQLVEKMKLHGCGDQLLFSMLRGSLQSSESFADSAKAARQRGEEVKRPRTS